MFKQHFRKNQAGTHLIIFSFILERTRNDNTFKKDCNQTCGQRLFKCTSLRIVVLISFMQAAKAPTSLYKCTVTTEPSPYNTSRDVDDVCAIQTLGSFFIAAHVCL